MKKDAFRMQGATIGTGAPHFSKRMVSKQRGCKDGRNTRAVLQMVNIELWLRGLDELPRPEPGLLAPG